MKKVSRSAVALTAGLIEHVLPKGNRKTPSVRVLTYHRIGTAKYDPFCVSAASFDEQMALLASEKRAVSLNDVEDFVKGETALPSNACLVTIDDGMHSTLSKALPILEKWNIPAVAFVSSKLIGLDTSNLPESYLDQDQLRELNASGLVTIGSHAHTHRSMGELDLCEMREEAIRSKEILSELIDEDVDSFAYPFGMQKDHNKQTDEILSECGYKIAFNSMHGSIFPGMNPISLPRVKVEGGESINMFRRISLGALDKWRIVDDHLWRLQRVRQEIT